jgi:hypothetical protein
MSGTSENVPSKATLRELRRAEAVISRWGLSQKEELKIAFESVQRLAAYWRALMFSYYTHQPNLWRKDQPPPIYVSPFSTGGVCLTTLRKSASASWSPQDHGEVARKLDVVVPTIEDVLDPNNKDGFIHDRKVAGARLKELGAGYLKIATEVGSLELALQLWDYPQLRR